MQILLVFVVLKKLERQKIDKSWMRLTSLYSLSPALSPLGSLVSKDKLLGLEGRRQLQFYPISLHFSTSGSSKRRKKCHFNKKLNDFDFDTNENILNTSTNHDDDVNSKVRVSNSLRPRAKSSQLPTHPLQVQPPPGVWSEPRLRPAPTGPPETGTILSPLPPRPCSWPQQLRLRLLPPAPSRRTLRLGAAACLGAVTPMRRVTAMTRSPLPPPTTGSVSTGPPATASITTITSPARRTVPRRPTAVPATTRRPRPHPWSTLATMHPRLGLAKRYHSGVPLLPVAIITTSALTIRPRQQPRRPPITWPRPVTTARSHLWPVAQQQ